MKKFLHVCLVLLVCILLTNGLYVSAQTGQMGQTGTVLSMFIRNEYQVDDKVANEIKSIKGYVANSYKCTTATKCKVAGEAYVSKLLAAFEKKCKYKADVVGNVCSEVAIVNILLNLKANNRLDDPKSAEDMFCEIMLYAIKYGYYHFATDPTKAYTTDTKTLYLKSLESFAKLGVLSSCTTKSQMVSFVKSEAEKANNVGFPILFEMGIPGSNIGHTISIIGVKNYNVKYKVSEKILGLFKSEKEYSKTITYFIVEDPNYPYKSFISESDIKSLGQVATTIKFKYED